MAAKDKDEALKRLGGGRWQTRDGRFTIEPQGGSWVVVDGEQTDDLGLPRVRGPFASLGAARAAIDDARIEDAPVSPLAARREEAAERPRPDRPAPKASPSRTRPPATSSRPAPPPPPASPPPPPEPDWVASLRPAERMAARALIARLEAAGVARPTDIARTEIVDGEPAVARVALRRAIAAAVAEYGGPERLAARMVALLGAGVDDALGVRWRLVDDDGRPIGDALADP